MCLSGCLFVDSMLIDCVGIAAMACRQKGFPLEPLTACELPLVRNSRHTAAGPVAQWLEPAAHNRLVGGSSPSGPTKIFVFTTLFSPVSKMRTKQFWTRFLRIFSALRPATTRRVAGRGTCAESELDAVRHPQEEDATPVWIQFQGQSHRRGLASWRALEQPMATGALRRSAVAARAPQRCCSLGGSGQR